MGRGIISKRNGWNRRNRGETGHPSEVEAFTVNQTRSFLPYVSDKWPCQWTREIDGIDLANTYVKRNKALIELVSTWLVPFLSRVCTFYHPCNAYCAWNANARIRILETIYGTMGPVPMIGPGIMEARFACNYTAGIIGGGRMRGRLEQPGALEGINLLWCQW